METLHEHTAEFFLMLQAELRRWRTIQGFLVFGSYTRAQQFNDIDLVGVLGTDASTKEGLKSLSMQDRAEAEYFLQRGEQELSIPPFQMQGYFGILQETPRGVLQEERTLEEQIRGFYNHLKGFNRLDPETRAEYGIEKAPADFRFSPKHTIWTRRTISDQQFGTRVNTLLTRLNQEYDQEIRSYQPLIQRVQ